MQLLIVLLPLLSPANNSTSEVGRAFIEKVMVARDFEAAKGLAAEDMLFTDPTAHTLGMALSEGIRGRTKILAKMRSFNVGTVTMEPSYEFSAGPYHCFVGTFSSMPPGAKAATGFPFMTVLQVEDGVVAERLDFGDYDPYIPDDKRIDGLHGDMDHPMVKSAKAYVAAYGQRDVETMGSLCADHVVFQDRTAAVIGAGDPIEGRAGVMGMLKSALASVDSFEIDADYMFFHGNYAVFAGDVSYSLPGARMGLEQETFGITHSMAIVLRFADGEIVRHDDFADYGSFLKAASKAKR